MVGFSVAFAIGKVLSEQRLHRARERLVGSVARCEKPLPGHPLAQPSYWPDKRELLPKP